jgi:hypothetical protein
MASEGNDVASTASSGLSTAQIFGQIGQAGEAFGGAVGDLFAAEGARQEAGAYGTAANIAGQEEALTYASGRIQRIQEQRQLNLVLGGQRAEIGAAGFANTGTAGDLLRASTQQGGLTQAITQIQTSTTASGYEEQRQADLAREQAAQGAAKAGIFGAIGGALKGGLALAPLVMGL